MIPLKDVLVFATAALLLALTPGPNMIYLLSRSLSQGKKAGLMSLAGVICSFFVHIILVSFGLTALLFAVPYAYTALKFAGAAYLLYLAFRAVRPVNADLFSGNGNLKQDKPAKLFYMGFLTNILNPKSAFFYLSFFPQFIKPDYGPVYIQTLQLGLVQMAMSFSVNATVILFAARMAGFFRQNPFWVSIQKWFMASVLTCLALKIAFAKAK